jgi:hypothetical protein
MDAIDGSELAVALRESAWLYPAVEALHILGLALVVGAAAAFDLRLLGLGSAIPLDALAGFLPRISLVAFAALALPSGVLLAVTQASALAANRAFWAKLALLAVAGTNAFLFQRRKHPSAALVSLASWIGVIACGRLLAYT